MGANRNEMDSYFDFHDAEREVHFKRHDMPTPWINYLSNGTFHTMLSQAGGGLAFYKSPQIWRITRYRFFHLPTDRSGPYIYIRDNKTGQYWSPTFEPTLSRPEEWEASHGMGYTRFIAKRDGIKVEVVYFIGEYENSLIWNIKIQNHSKEAKNLSIFTYVEFGMMEFMRELQWLCYNKHQVSVRYLTDVGALVYRYGVENQPKKDETPLVYFAANKMPDAYDGDRDEFIGTYRSEANPIAIENGYCNNSTLLGGDPCGALQFNMTLEPSEEQPLHIFLGTGMSDAELITSIANSRDTYFVENSFHMLREHWNKFLYRFTCDIPDKDAERMINIWNPYQAQRNFLFSRNISYYATGTFRGVGFRDTAQDILALVPFDIVAAKDKIRLLLGQQYQDGHVNHYFFPIEGWEPVTSIHSDDHLWPIWSVWSVIMETGDLSFLEERVQYFDGSNGTVYEHLCNAIAYTKSHLGPNGFPLMLRSDWNDQLFRVCKEGRGESIWTSMQFGTMLMKLSELAKLSGNTQDEVAFNKLFDEQSKLINSCGWDGHWFKRAIMDDGRYLGTNESDEAKIWLNSQTWAVISGMANQENAIMAMDSVKSILNTELGIKKLHPPITTFPDPNEPLTNYLPGTGENGSVFCHTNAWAIIAECLLGRGDQAFQYYRQLIPNITMERVGIWRYKAEPYVYASNLFGPDADKFGLANVSWLTGTAAWMYIAATQFILGIKPLWGGLQIEPCIPSDWRSIVVERVFRGCHYTIEIRNDKNLSHGISRLIVNGEVIKGNIIPHDATRTNVSVVVIME